MQPTTAILAKINSNSTKNKDEVFTRLFRYLLRPDLYFLAYKNLYANDGAATKGVDNDTADGFSEAKVARIIMSLQKGTYQPKPVRRIYVKKKDNPKKERPIGIPTFTDKLVQEVLRMVLEAVYEPVFLDCSHGFRPNMSCHTALKSLKKEFNGSRWFVEGDIKGCFDNIDHAVLINLLNQKIKDARLTQLIYKFLKAGYVDNWKYNDTYSGTPQGGILSPLLANVYLHELDKFVVKLQCEFKKPRETQVTLKYNQLTYQRLKLKRRISEAESFEREKLLREYKNIRAEIMKTPCSSQTDKTIKYVRYADDFLIAVKGNHADCEEIKRKLTEFIGNTLKMELSEEKTLITHSSEYARFLGYNVRVRRDDKVIGGGNKRYTMRTLNNRTELAAPFDDKIHKFIISKGIAIQQQDGTLFPVKRKELIGLTDLEIISVYNDELRGICNYYNLASNFCHFNYLEYLMRYSCFKTLAGKHKSKISKIVSRYNDGRGGFGIPYEAKKGTKRRYFAKYADCKSTAKASDVIVKPGLIYGYSSNSLEKRIKAHTCELCGATDAKDYQVHHINKLKNLKGKEAWECAMIAKKRKTLVVCVDCHNKIHNT